MIFVNVFVFVLVLGVIILVHEFGHYYFAKKAGILCHEFAIGMGPVAYQKRKGETVYSIRMIPIGGFVSMAGESINDALIKKEDRIGVELNPSGQIVEIVLTDKKKASITGTVQSFDLYGKDQSPLFIELDIEGTMTRYPVSREAVYTLSETKQMWITPQEKSFESKTLSQRFMVIFAGPLMNFILALLLFFIVGWFVTKPNLDQNEIGSVASNSPADSIGIKSGDRLVNINGNPITTWSDIGLTMSSITKASVSVQIERNGQTFEHEIIPVILIQSAGISNFKPEDTKNNTPAIRYADLPIIGRAFGRASTNGGLKTGDRIVSLSLGDNHKDIHHWDDILLFFNTVELKGVVTVTYLREGNVLTTSYDIISQEALEKLGASAIVNQIGISPTSSFDFLYSLSYPWDAFKDSMGQVLATIGLLFNRNENLGIGDLSGPVGIFNLVSATRSQGLLAVIGFTAFLSINIGLLNLLPIPALDGGRLVFLGIEAITRKPINRKLENIINNVMLFVLLGLFVYVTYNDIFRLIRGS